MRRDPNGLGQLVRLPQLHPVGVPVLLHQTYIDCERAFRIDCERGRRLFRIDVLVEVRRVH